MTRLRLVGLVAALLLAGCSDRSAEPGASPPPWGWELASGELNQAG